MHYVPDLDPKIFKLKTALDVAPQQSTSHTTTYANDANDRRLLVWVGPRSHLWVGGQIEAGNRSGTLVNLGAAVGVVFDLSGENALEVWSVGLSVNDLLGAAGQVTLRDPSGSPSTGAIIPSPPPDMHIVEDAGYLTPSRKTTLTYESANSDGTLSVEVSGTPSDSSFLRRAATDWLRSLGSVDVHGGAAALLSSSDLDVTAAWVDTAGNLVIVTTHALGTALTSSVVQNLRTVSDQQWADVLSSAAPG